MAPSPATNPVIRLQDVSKAYRLYASPSDRLKEALSPFRHTYHSLFHALEGVNLEVHPRETVGVIGVNGSGKSTLLKLICGVSRPTGGKLTVDGRISAILELGAGFNPEFTGRQNAFFGGTLAGMAREEMERRMARVEAFAGIGEFMDQPVKNYSSGMAVRLAFALAVNVDPDILVVDEALAVGDARFSHKCMARIHEIKERATVLFVTHDLNIAMALCDRVVWLSAGRVMADGNPKEVVNRYREASYEGVARTKRSVRLADENGASSEREKETVMSGRAAIGEVRLVADDNGESLTKVAAGRPVALELDVEVAETIAEPIFSFAAVDERGMDVFGYNNLFLEKYFPELAPGERLTVRFTFPWPAIRAGSYSFIVAVAGGSLEKHQMHHLLMDVLPITCISGTGSPGVVDLSGSLDCRVAVQAGV